MLADARCATAVQTLACAITLPQGRTTALFPADAQAVSITDLADWHRSAVLGRAAVWRRFFLAGAMQKPRLSPDIPSVFPSADSPTCWVASRYCGISPPTLAGCMTACRVGRRPDCRDDCGQATRHSRFVPLRGGLRHNGFIATPQQLC